MLKFLVILIFSFFISSSFAGICPGTDLTDELRKTIVDVHNELRSELAQGKSIMKNNKTAPPAKNMYKMRYDCCLEASAQSVVETCEMKHSKHECRNSGENLWAKGSSNADPKNDIPGALKGWWSELANRGETVPIYQDGIGHWAAMAWAEATAVGCGYKSCEGEDKTILACHYRAGVYGGAPIYIEGSPCTADTDCTPFPNSTCNTSTKFCETTYILKETFYSSS